VQNPVHAWYPLAQMTNSVLKLINVRQMEDESVEDYMKCFKKLKDINKTYW